jgi:hypothetical protein
MSTHDWDDSLDPAQRSRAMDYTRARLGLPARQDHFKAQVDSIKAASPKNIEEDISLDNKQFGGNVRPARKA